MRLPPSGLAGILLLLFVAHALSASLIKTPTYDEPAHIGAGLSYLRTRDFKVNLQHPPLLKELAALPLLVTGVRWPVSAEAWAALGPLAPPGFQWQLGNAVLFANDPARVLFWSRLPLLLLTALLGWVLWAWGRAMLGPAAGLSALLLFAFDPGMLAHGALVTTDTGCAALSTLCLFALWRYLRERRASRLLTCGLALGAALAAKFSALLLLPIVTVLLLFATREARATPAAGAEPDVADNPAQSAGDHARRLLGAGAALLAVTAVAVLVVAVVYLGRGPWLYVEGLRLVNADHNPDYWPFMAGQFRPRFWSYYVVVYLLKEPIPSIVLAAVGLWAIFRRSAATPIDRTFLILPPLAFVGAYTAFSHDLGLRYLIPALPFLHLMGGAGLAAMLQRGPRARVLGVGLAVWLGLGSLGIYPDHLSYFNEAACALAAPARGRTRRRHALRTGLARRQQRGLGAGPRPARRLARAAPVADAGVARVLRQRPARALRCPGPAARRATAAAAAAARTLRAERPRVRAPAGRARGAGEGWLLGQSPSAVIGHAYYVFDVP